MAVWPLLTQSPWIYTNKNSELLIDVTDKNENLRDGCMAPAHTVILKVHSYCPSRNRLGNLYLNSSLM